MFMEFFYSTVKINGNWSPLRRALVFALIFITSSLNAASPDLLEIQLLVGAQNSTRLAAMINENQTVSFRPESFSSLENDPLNSERLMFEKVVNIETSVYGALGYLLSQRIAIGQNAQDAGSEANFLSQVLNFSRLRMTHEALNESATLKLKLERGRSSTGLIWNLAVENAVATSQVEILERVIQVYQELGADPTQSQVPFLRSDGSIDSHDFLNYWLTLARYPAFGDGYMQDSETVMRNIEIALSNIKLDDIKKLRTLNQHALERHAAEIEPAIQEADPRNPMTVLEKESIRALIRCSNNPVFCTLFEGLTEPDKVEALPDNVRADLIPRYLKLWQVAYGEAEMRRVLNTPWAALIGPANSEPLKRLQIFSLMRAVSYSNSQSFPYLKLLIKLGGDLNAPAMYFAEPLNILLSDGTAIINRPDMNANTRTPGDLAASGQDVPALLAMISSGLVMDSQSSTGFNQTLLHSALAGKLNQRFVDLNPEERKRLEASSVEMRKFVKPAVETVKAILDNGANPDGMSAYFGPEGQIWNNVTEFELKGVGISLPLAKFLAEEVAPLFDASRLRLRRPLQHGMPKLTETGVCKHILSHMGRAKFRVGQ